MWQARMVVRVLSIQSHVVSGYVGNKCASFPLQVLGFDVDTINSVQFSNSKRYQHCKGEVLDDVQLGELFDGLKLNELDNYSHLLTGYISSASFLQKIEDIVKHLKTVNPNLIYVCDPVMGDNGRMYVSEELLPIYRDRIIPLADIVTPNQFEAEMLTGKKIKNKDDAVRVMKWFHQHNVKTVVLSSTDLGKENEVLGFASTLNDGTKVFQFHIPRLPASFSGTGDLFAALLLGWMHLSGNDLQATIENTLGTMQAVLQRTLEIAHAGAGENVPLSAKDLELKIVQSQDDIRNPKSKVDFICL